MKWSLPLFTFFFLSYYGIILPVGKLFAFLATKLLKKARLGEVFLRRLNIIYLKIFFSSEGGVFSHQIKLIKSLYRGVILKVYADVGSGWFNLDLDRIDRLLREKPDFIFIHLGANDVIYPKNCIAEITAKVESVARRIAEKTPHSHIVLASMPNLSFLFTNPIHLDKNFVYLPFGLKVSVRFIQRKLFGFMDEINKVCGNEEEIIDFIEERANIIESMQIKTFGEKGIKTHMLDMSVHDIENHYRHLHVYFAADGFHLTREGSDYISMGNIDWFVEEVLGEDANEFVQKTA